MINFNFYKSSLLFFSFFMLFFLPSCCLLTPYKSPLTLTPHQWKNKLSIKEADKESQSLFPPCQEISHEKVCADLTNWWKIFNDPLLDCLEEQALKNSYTLWAALERVIQNRLLAAAQQANLWPGLTFNPSFNRSGQLLKNPLSSTSGASSANDDKRSNLSKLTSLNEGGLPPQAADTRGSISVVDYRFNQSQYLLPLNLNYEIDLWGRLNYSYYAALVRSEAASDAYRSVLLSLTADIASIYFEIRGLDSQLAVIEKSLFIRQEEVTINQSRYLSGLIPFVDVSRGQVELSRAKSDKDNVQRIRSLQENRLASLIGSPASLFSLQANPVLISPPLIPSGLPSQLLCRRPDIAEAERLLSAFYYEIGVAKANFFPSLSLNASLGLQSPFAHSLFKWKARFWEMGLNALQTVFDGGRNQANFKYCQSHYRESFSNYQQTVLYAFEEVENALSNLHFYAEQSKDLKEAVEASRLTFHLSQLRYTQGLVNYLDVVDAERELLQTEQNLTNVLANRYLATIQLIKALGGGWEESEKVTEINFN